MQYEPQIGRYEIIDRIGKGLQGAVFKARDPELDRLVAIKLLHPGMPGSTTSGDADQSGVPLEARISGKLRHPNIIPIFDFGRLGEQRYLVFEYVEGQTLRQLLGSHGRLPIEQVCQLASPIIDAIAYAHGEDVVHLDLGLKNLLVDTHQVPRVMDFGLSQICKHFIEQGNEIKGTPLYMAPEYFTGEPLGPHTDIYAIGASLFHLAAGTPTVGGTSLHEIGQQVEKAPVDFDLIPDCEHKQGFVAILRACLEKDFLRRLQSGAQLKQLFQRFLLQCPVTMPGAGTEVHSTVQFLLRRMQRKEDFPGISRVLNDINRLTSEDDAAPAQALADVILLDYALTNKLLRLVNSAFFANSSSAITSVSKAIVVLGVQKVRSIANSLAYFGRLQSDPDNVRLRDTMLQSQLSGLLTRKLVEQSELGDPEEGYICGLFQNLGENLTAYYFPEDHREIQSLKRETGEDKSTVSRRILGVPYSEIGFEVARVWGLPSSIIASIRGPDNAAAESRRWTDMALSRRAILANQLCDIANEEDAAARQRMLDTLIADAGEELEISLKSICQMLEDSLASLREVSGILEFDYQASRYYLAAQTWLEQLRSEAGEQPARAAS